MTAPPATFASLKRVLGIAKEATPGTPVNPTMYIPFTKFDWNDKPTWLMDQGVRGVMANDAFAIVQGVEVGEIDFEGPAYADTVGFLVGNLLGDVTATGTAVAPTGTLAALSAVGATSVSSSVSIPSGTLIQIDTGNNAEVVTTSGAPTGAGPYTIPVPALAKAHANAVAITAVQSTGPFAHAFSLMNSGAGAGQVANTAQPTAHTLTQYYGPAATSGTRQFAFGCVTEIGFKWTAESEFLIVTAKIAAYISNIPGSGPTAVYTGAQPVPSWRGLLGLGGPASGGTLVASAESGEFNLKRAVKPYFTAQNSQNPYMFQRGPVTADFKHSFVIADETQYLYMRNNTQPQLQFLLSNGLSGAAALGFQFDMQAAAFTEAKPDFGSEAIRLAATGRGVLNTTNAGFTGGYSPAKVTLTNAIVPGTYL